MVKLIIRDDDCNFFTRPNDIERVYSSIPKFPISFAVVPEITDCCGGCPETIGNEIPRPIGGNTELIAFLKEKYKEGQCDVLLHGITHGYHFISGKKIPEMIWRNSDSDLRERIKTAKLYLENILGFPITCFVAPSNKIKLNGIKSVIDNGMDFSGIIPISFQRKLSWASLYNYSKRIMVRAVKGLPYPGVLSYPEHKELNACNTIDKDYLIRMFNYCRTINSPMAINVHYWHMRDFPNRYQGFFDFIKFAIDNGAEPSRMRDCI